MKFVEENYCASCGEQIFPTDKTIEIAPGEFVHSFCIDFNAFCIDFND